MQKRDRLTVAIRTKIWSYVVRIRIRALNSALHGIGLDGSSRSVGWCKGMMSSRWNEIRGQIGFVFGFVDIEIAGLPEDDGRVARDKKRGAGKRCVHDLVVSSLFLLS